MNVFCMVRGHFWRFYKPRGGYSYMGYLERCTRCGEIRQVPQ